MKLLGVQKNRYNFGVLLFLLCILLVNFCTFHAINIPVNHSLGFLPDGDINTKHSNNIGYSPSLQSNFSQITQEDHFVYVETDRLTITFDLAADGYISNITNSQTQQQLLLSSQYNRQIWLIEFLDDSWYSNLDALGFTYVLEETKMVFSYTFGKLGHDIVVQITYQLNDPHAGLNSKISVTCSDLDDPSAIPGIRRVFFPYFAALQHWATNDDMERIIIPEREGWMFTEPFTTFTTEGYGSTYPGTLSMQFCVLAEPDAGGFVISARDSRSQYKGIEIGPAIDGLMLNWFLFCEHAHIHEWSNLTMSYWMVLDGYAGRTWASGVDQYKEWALQQWYVQKGPVVNRSDIPTWLKMLDYVWKSSSYATHDGMIILEGDTVDRMGEYASKFASKGLSTNVLLDWWGWQKGGHDNDYPEYFPARDGNNKLLAGITAAHARNTRVMLYLNGRLVDTDTQTYLDHIDDLTGYEDDVYIESYGPYFTAAVADPASAWWQELVTNVSVRCVNEFGADMIYLDQISVAPPVFDYRPNVDHPIGGGSWWQEAENQLLGYVQTNLLAVNPEAGIASENVIETYLNSIDLFWTYQTSYQVFGWFPKGTAVPLFSYVYHKYALLNGRSDISPWEENTFRWAVSEALLSGYLPGGPGALSDLSEYSSPNMKVLKNAYLTRQIGDYQFLRDGDLLAPLSWNGIGTMQIGGSPVPQGILQGYLGNSGNIAFLWGNRGSSKLSWSGSLVDLLILSGVEVQLNDFQEISIYQNGKLESTFLPTERKEVQVELFPGEFCLVWLIYESSTKTTTTGRTNDDSGSSTSSAGFLGILASFQIVGVTLVFLKKIRRKQG
ncbi:MAG: DUF6259 domain-containing protein [Candidatus Hodarchaeota archaeon]